uniref:ubiquitinyl hydrolase 1 n=1 Tax=Hirondellea gigas TaxID=1518452 RepID=A0A6A7G8B2_9CRUS
MSNNNSNFSNTFSSIAFEHLTGNKLPATQSAALLAGLQPVSSAATTSSSNSSNGTGQWAVGMANAGDVLGNLGMGDSARNTTWDIPPHTTYPSTHQRDLLASSKETLPDLRSRSRSNKKNISNVGQSNSRSNNEKHSTGTGPPITNNYPMPSATRSRGSSSVNPSVQDVGLLSHSSTNSSISNSLPKLTTVASGRSEACSSSHNTNNIGNSAGGVGVSCDGVYIADGINGVPTLYSYPDSQSDKLFTTGGTANFTTTTATTTNLSSPLTPTTDALVGEYGSSSRKIEQSAKHCSKVSSTGSHDSRASTPSSNCNSLTKKNWHHVDEALDDRDISNTSPYFHLSKNGLDQLEVLSDSGGSASPDTVTGSITDGSGSGGSDLDVGSMVEIVIRGMPRFGVVRWIGTVPGDKKEGRTVAGVELEDGTYGLSDGTFAGRRHFCCAAGKAIFVNLNMCHQDSRFLESLASSIGNPRASIAFGCEDSGPIGGRVAPPSGSGVRAMIGRNKGIQGHQNSCYLDATLFSMFAFTSVFDSLLFRPATSSDISSYSEVQEVLREEIVNPLRTRMFVRADRIMKLRTCLDNLSSVRGLTTEEKDPEEFLHSLLAQILKAEPYLQLSSGQEAYHYQLFLDKDKEDDKVMPSVQYLFERSFLTSDIKLKQVPSILILQMPRFGKEYKMYSRILPSLLLDVTDVIEDSPRQCHVCGRVAYHECAQCFGECGSGLESIALCNTCVSKVHTHKKRGSHTSIRELRVPADYTILADHCTVPRIYMELFAVVCIETSHYVTFTRCGEGPEAPWCFFDSMADRKGEQHGYNIPLVQECAELQEWLGMQGGQARSAAVPDDKSLPDLTRRLLCDAYMCFYHSSKVAMYR